MTLPDANLCPRRPSVWCYWLIGLLVLTVSLPLNLFAGPAVVQAAAVPTPSPLASPKTPANLPEGLYPVVQQTLRVDSNSSSLLEHQKINPTDLTGYDRFGLTMALSEDGQTALIGTPFTNSNQGAVYVFVKSGTTWIQQQTLTISDGIGLTPCFGASIALSSDGQTALIGAYGNNGFRGITYVFGRSGTTWTRQQILTASDAAINDYFGASIALSSDGQTALISSPYTISDQGAVYVFVKSGTSWIQQQKLTATDIWNSNYFGGRVELSSDGQTALIGANNKNTYKKGAVYVFVKSDTGWLQQQKLTASDGEANDNFGGAIKLTSDGQTALIGACGKDSSKGAVYIFGRGETNWIEQQKLVASDGAISDNFGSVVALSSNGQTALIGAYVKNDAKGAAYLATKIGTTWIEQQKLVAADGVSTDEFGAAVALSSDGQTAFIDAPLKNGGLGAVYIFTPPITTSLTVEPVSGVYSGTGVLSTTLTAAGYPVTSQMVTFTLTDGVISKTFTHTTDINGQAIINNAKLIGLRAGSYQTGVKADFGYASAYLASTASSSLTINQITTTTSLASNPSDTATYGQSVTFTATVAPIPDGGIATFTFDNSSSVTATVNTTTGLATYITNTLSPGQHNVQAVYSGNVDYASSSASPLSLTINQASTTTSLTVAPNPVTVGQSVYFTATVTPLAASGTVTFTLDGATNLTATLSNGQASYVTDTLAVGSHSVSASYGGDVDYTGSSTTDQSFSVVAGCVPLLVTNTSDNGIGDTCGTFSYALTQATIGQTISFTLTSGSTITFTGTLTATVPAGVIIDGGAGITLDGNGQSGDGLHLKGTDTLKYLTIKHFAGRELVTDGPGNILDHIRLLQN